MYAAFAEARDILATIHDEQAMKAQAMSTYKVPVEIWARFPVVDRATRLIKFAQITTAEFLFGSAMASYIRGDRDEAPFELSAYAQITLLASAHLWLSKHSRKENL